MQLLQRNMQGIVYKIERISTGVLWNILQELKEYGKATALEKNVLVINLN